jgi:hypothetical protein
MHPAADSAGSFTREMKGNVAKMMTAQAHSVIPPLRSCTGINGTSADGAVRLRLKNLLHGDALALKLV